MKEKVCILKGITIRGTLEIPGDCINAVIENCTIIP